MKKIDTFICRREFYSLFTNKTIRAASTVVLLTFLLLIPFNTSAQKSPLITGSYKNTPVATLIRNLERQYGYDFVYKSSDLSQSKPITATFKEATIEEVLRSCFENSPFSYEVNGKSIILKLKPQSKAQPKPETRELCSGRVTDKQGNPIVGVTITVVGTTQGTVTDSQGDFKLKLIPNAETIRISYIGYENQEVKWDGRSTLKIVLKEKSESIDEVIVTGIFRKSAETFTGSASTVTAKEIQQFGNRNVLSTLRNIDPAFNIIESNEFGSNPNKLPEIQVRGTSSLPNVTEIKDGTSTDLNTPLVILDGFETSLQTLIDMNVNEISSITLLKDASATAIYGSRGANGVIVVETKVPEQGKLKVSYRGDLNLEIPDLTSYSLLNAREKLDLEYKVGKFDNARAERDVVLKQYYNYLLNEVNSGVDTYWLSKPLRVGVGQRHNVRIEGGDNTFRYSASVQMNNIEGVMKKSSRENLNANVNLTYRMKNLSFSNNIILGFNNSHESPYGSFSNYVQMNPYFRAEDPDGNTLKKVTDGQPNMSSRWGSSGIANPLWNAQLNGFDKTHSNTITDNFQIDWSAKQYWRVRARASVTKTISGSDLFTPAENTKYADYTEEDLLRKGEYTVGNSESFSYEGSLNVSYARSFAEKHLIYAAIDGNVRHSSSDSYSMTAEGFTNSDMSNLSMALQYATGGKPSGSESKQRSIGITGNVNYSYDNRYYIDLSLRSDGNSAFGSKNRFANFWSAGLGWNIHNEKFFVEKEWMNKLKVRGSVGTSGSQKFSSYQALTTYKYYTDKRYYSWMGAYVMGLGNENLKWQQKMNYNIGFDAELFKRRIQVSFDTYLEQTNDLVSSLDLPSSTGFASYIENVGKVENRGFELKVTTYLIRDTEKRLNWSITGAIIHNKNKIVAISETMKKAQADLEASKSANPNTLFREGYSENTIWVVPSAGIDPSSGREIFIDRFGNQTYTWDALDKVACGESEPKYKGNINTNFRWRNWLITASFGYNFGGQLYNSTLIGKVENTNYNSNVDSRVYTSRWQNPGDKAAFKSIYVTNSTSMTSRFVEDEKTFRCQNVNLTYEINSERFQKKTGLNLLSISFSMADLFYISSVERERGTSYPFSRQLSCSLNITF